MHNTQNKHTVNTFYRCKECRKTQEDKSKCLKCGSDTKTMYKIPLRKAY